MTDLILPRNLHLPNHMLPGMWVNGQCQVPPCTNWFTVYVRYDEALQRDGTPDTCSKICSSRRKARRKKERDREERAAKQAAGLAKRALRIARRICWTCWENQITDPRQGVCDDCFELVERSCRGKVRHDTEADAAGQAGRFGDGVPMEHYRCGLCQWWHVGTRVGRRRHKLIRFVVHTFVNRSDPLWLADLRVAWFESRSGWRRPTRVAS